MTMQHAESVRRALIVTALPVEYAAVRGHLKDLAEKEHPQGDIYEQGIFQADGQQWQVGIVEMGMGNPNAAQKSERAIAHFQPEAVLFVGIAGGIKDAKIADVVVASKVYGYHFGKAAEDFKTRPEVGLPGHRLLERARAEARKPDWLTRLPEIPLPAPKVFLGAIAAGEQVVTSTQSVSYQLIRNSYNDALALEMESYGFFKAVQAHSGLEALAVRGISDLLEGKSEADGGGSQERASQHAAAFAFEVLAKLKLPEKNVRVEVREIVREVPAPSAPLLSNLPHQPFFFGRTKELASIAEAISPEARTWGALIDGPGGIGKTALAIKAGHDAPAAHFERKIFLSAKVRELTPTGEQSLDDFISRDYQTLLADLARELDADNAAQAAPEERVKAVHHALTGKRILLVIDNVETFPETERVRLYQFLSRLPEGCKAIVTSRRRTDIDARVIRLDRLERQDAFALLDELAKDNPHLSKATAQERGDLYEITGGNPLIIRWTVGQLGRTGSRCRTVAEACAFLEAAPKGNDPLEYIFGDLVDTFTESETAVLAALALFSHPAPVEQIAAVAGIAAQSARTALEDLNSRALLVADEEG
uniref:phosphorylase family protein n=1 Tax=Candidatus Electronema sp. TaxID=2698783 RepID=UPI004055CFBD